MTKSIGGHKVLGILVTLGAALVLFSGTASAVTYQWSPQNTAWPLSGTLTFTDNKANSVRCTISGHAEAPTNGDPSHAHTVDATGNSAAPAFSGCSSSLGTPSWSCTTSWYFKATSTSTVDISNIVCTITVSSIGSCTITMGTTSNPLSITGNSWSNTNSLLTLNSSVNFSISESGLACDGATSAHLSGTIQFGSNPGDVTIVAV